MRCLGFLSDQSATSGESLSPTAARGMAAAACGGSVLASTAVETPPPPPDPFALVGAGREATSPSSPLPDSAGDASLCCCCCCPCCWGAPPLLLLLLLETAEVRTLAAATANRSRASSAPASTGEGREDGVEKESAAEKPAAAAAKLRSRATTEETAPAGARSALETAEAKEDLARLSGITKKEEEEGEEVEKGKGKNSPKKLFCFICVFCCLFSFLSLRASSSASSLDHGHALREGSQVRRQRAPRRRGVRQRPRQLQLANL